MTKEPEGYVRVPLSIRLVDGLRDRIRPHAKSHGRFEMKPQWRLSAWLHARAGRRGLRAPLSQLPDGRHEL